MVIQIRGTSGSGKSTVMRAVMDKIGGWSPLYVHGRRRPLLYRSGCLTVLGHYEVDCGGGDTVGSAPKIFDLAKQRWEAFEIVLCEGLLLSEDVKWTLQMPEPRCVFLNTSRDECLRRVLEIRRGGKSPVDPSRIERKLSKRIETIERAQLRLKDAGVVCKRATCEGAVTLILNWIEKATQNAK